MPGDGVEPRAGREFPLGIGGHGLEQLAEVGHGAVVAEDAAVDLGQDHGIVVGGAPQHDAVHMRQFRLGRGPVGDAAIDGDRKRGEARPQAVHAVVVERRNGAVFLGAQPLEPGFRAWT